MLDKKIDEVSCADFDGWYNVCVYVQTVCDVNFCGLQLQAPNFVKTPQSGRSQRLTLKMTKLKIAPKS